MAQIRTAARALILQNNKLLTIKMRDQSGVFHILPGGGQNKGETLQQSLRRECLEEIGVEVEVGELLYVREYIGKNHAFRKAHHAFHQVESVFQCTLREAFNPNGGTELDKKQIGIEWLDINTLSQKRFLPKSIIPFFKNGAFTPAKTYLGDIN